MTTTEPPPVDEAPETTETDDATRALEAARAAHREALLTRLVLPLVVPICAAVAVAAYVLNVSRVFIVAKHGGEVGDVIAGMVFTLGILFGASYVAARPRLRSSALTMTTMSVLMLVIAMGLVVLGPSVHSEGGGSSCAPSPKGDAASTVAVEALDSIKFDATEYTATAGVVEVDYSGANGHTLAFTAPGPSVGCFELKLPSGPKTAKVDLKAGTYTIYCTVPGHKSQGMEAILTVS